MRSTLTSKGQSITPSDERRMRSVLGRGKRKLQGKTVEQWLEYLRGPVDLPKAH